MIRFIIAAIFIVAGIFVFAAAAFGVFKFKYVLNRMHVAAKCDSLGALLILVGCMILGGFSFMTLKLLLVLLILWITSPVAAHLIVLEFTLITFLIVCAIAFAFSKRLLTSVIIFMSYSLIMSIIWFIMESPDLAITEAAVGAGVTSVLLFLTLKKVNVLKGKKDE